MKYSTTNYPETGQVIILLIILFVLRFAAKYMFSFIDSETLKQLCLGLLNLSVLLIFVVYVFKRDIMDTPLFNFADVQISITLASILGGLSIMLLPVIPRLSYLDDAQVDSITIDATHNQADLWYFLYMCLVTPVFEEILFRGLILGALLRWFLPFTAIAVSSILFSLLHISILEAFLFACLVGWIYHYTRNIIYPVLVHGIENLVGFATRYILNKGHSSFSDINGFFEDNKVLISLVCLSFLFGSIYLLYRTGENQIRLITKDRNEIQYKPIAEGIQSSLFV